LFHHVTVLKKESVEGLNIKKDGIYVDCTLGGAGHSCLIAAKLGAEGTLIGIDQDQIALNAASERLQGVDCQIRLVKSNFKDIKKVLTDLGLAGVDGILFDLGVSSPQLDEAERGFSYNHDAPLDMRMDQEGNLTAYDIINGWDDEELASIIYRYGEEKFSRRIAKSIVEARKDKPIESTLELAEIVKLAIPAATRRTGPHPAKRTFQAIRIAVNDELDVFASALEDAIECLNPNGRVSVITFHSLEDRICKQTFQKYVGGCTCPPDFPKCVCNHKATLHIVTRKPIAPSDEELESNPRARSAKLRIAEKNEV
jgi:16S rRNA (cytosine1402-N4)-methyltransferase